ncbi:MAG: hypothetical protein IPF82_06730 [Blastocatellia bacterium]|nr:hypothetical protein [Blastocatellia bacterium]
MFDQLSKPKSKFPLILAGSITLHGALVGMLFVSWVWGIALKFGEIRFEDGGESTVKSPCSIARNRCTCRPASTR